MTDQEPEATSFSGLRLRFEDADIERGFLRHCDAEVRQAVRAGMLFSFVTWSFALGVTWVILPENFPHLCLVVVVGFWPFLALGTAATFGTRFSGYYEWIGTVGNILAGMFVVYVGSFFPSAEYVVMGLMAFGIMFGAFLQRFRFKTSLVAATLYLVAFHAFLLSSEGSSWSTALVPSALLCAFAISSAVASFLNERTQRTLYSQQLLLDRERERSDQLLLRVFPGGIAARLKRGEGPIADGLADVTILFADIVGFTPMSEQLGPKKLVEVLNDLFLRFDEIAERHGVEKIETIGDAYLAAGGAPSELEGHPNAVAAMALEMVATARQVEVAPGEHVRVRIGIHTGPLVAGVIGKKRLHYDVFGETVNVASRIESSSAPERILVSEVTYKRIKRNFATETNETVELKGHGPVRTWWLTGVARADPPEAEL